MFTWHSLDFPVAFGHCKKKKSKRTKQALHLRPSPASTLVKIHSSSGEISDVQINKINTRCFQIDLILFWVYKGFRLHIIFFFQPWSNECNHKQGGDWGKNAFGPFAM